MSGRVRLIRQPAAEHFRSDLRCARSRAEACTHQGALPCRRAGSRSSRDLQSDRLRDTGDTVIDPNSSKGTVSAIVTLAMPLKNALSKADTTYSISLDLGALAVDKLAMNQKLEASSLKVVADNQGYRVKATSRSRATCIA
jgi:hypothetical protein